MYGNVGTIYHREISEGLSDKVTGTWKKTGSGPGFIRQRIAQEEVASAQGLERRLGAFVKLIGHWCGWNGAGWA